MLRRFGWTKNPFDPNLPSPEFLVYKDQTQKLIEKIKENRLMWINAPMGVGKTTILKYIATNSRRYGLKALYWHYGSKPSLEDFKSASRTLFPTFWERFRRKTRAILIDEANYIQDKEFFKYLVGLLDDERIHPSLVFAAVTGPPTAILYETFKDRALEIVTIASPSEEDAVNMVRRRIESAGGRGLEPPFDEETTRALVKESATPRILLEKLMALAAGEEFVPVSAPAPLVELREIQPAPIPSILEQLSAQQRRIVNELSISPKTVKDLAQKLDTSDSGIRGQLNRLSSLDFLKERGYRMPIVERIGDKWHIHREFTVAHGISPGEVKVSVPAVRKVKKLKKEELLPPPEKPSEEFSQLESNILRILKERNALSTPTALVLEDLFTRIQSEMPCSKEEVHTTVLALYNRGKVVYLDSEEKVFLV